TISRMINRLLRYVTIHRLKLIQRWKYPLSFRLIPHWIRLNLGFFAPIGYDSAFPQPVFP
ncbi:MAG: hypothetical protein CVU16_10195, partial [Betaproteobacteria bacterium HGW-Betaproteobacteria-10]